MIIESIPNALRSAISAGIGIFLAYVGIKNAGLLKFSIDPHTYTVAGEGADRRMRQLQQILQRSQDSLVSIVRQSSLLWLA